MNKSPSIFVLGLSGESLFFEVDHFNEPGETVIANSLHTEPGGKGFNQAMALKKLGADVHFLTITGDDVYATIIEKELLNIKVIPHIIKVPGTITARSCIITNKEGENRVCVYPGVASNISPDIIDQYQEPLSKCDYLLLQLEYPLALAKRAIDIAKRNGVKIIINPAPAARDSYSLLKEADLITPNETEARTIFGVREDSSVSELAEKVNASGIKRVVVTLGKAGSVVIWDGNVTHIPALALKDSEVVDTTGAGDIYNASLLYRVSIGDSIATAGYFASIVSGLSVKKKHVLNSVPTREEIKKYLK